jgi:uncharacterized protein YxeA
MKKILISLVLSIFMIGCSTLEVDVDYDPSYDFNAKTKYVILHKTKEGESTLTNDRITTAIQNNLDARGYHKVEQKDADLIFVFHVNVKDKTDISTDYQMVGFGRGRGMGSGVIATTDVYNYTEGKLIIDALNPKTRKLVWRGVATDELNKNIDTPKKRQEYISKIVQQLMQNFPKKRD